MTGIEYPTDPQASMSEMSQRLDDILPYYKERVERFLHDLSIGTAWPYFRQPHEIKVDADAFIVDSIKEKELEIDSNGREIINFYQRATYDRMTELCMNNEPLQKLLKLNGMFEHLSIHYQRNTPTVDVSSINYDADKTSVVVNVPSSLEEYFMLESAVQRLTLATFNEPTDSEHSWIKAPSFVALLWIQHTLDSTTTNNGNTGLYL